MVKPWWKTNPQTNATIAFSNGCSIPHWGFPAPIGWWLGGYLQFSNPPITAQPHSSRFVGCLFQRSRNDMKLIQMSGTTEILQGQKGGCPETRYWLLDISKWEIVGLQLHGVSLKMGYPHFHNPSELLNVNIFSQNIGFWATKFSDTLIFWLVLWTPLKNMKVSWDDYKPNIWENKIHGNQTTNQYRYIIYYYKTITGWTTLVK